MKFAREERRWVLLILFAIATCSAQTNSPPQSSDPVAATTLRSTTRVVVLDVVVTDANGRPVEGLQKSDFTLLEDGTQQAVSGFEAHGSSHPTDTPEAPAQNILLLDEVNTRFTNLAFARKCVHRLIEQHGAQLEQPTSLLVLVDHGLIVLQEPTRDGNALLAAMDRHHPALPTQLMLAGAEHDTQRVLWSLTALRKIAQAGAGSNVRRNLLWISGGFPATSPESTNDSGRTAMYDAIRRISVELLQARTTLYTIDPSATETVVSGVDTYGQALDHIGPSSYNPGGSVNAAAGSYVQSLSSHGSRLFPDMILQRFAQETGGRSFWGRNDLDAELAAARTESARYYTISYSPSDRNFDGRFRTIVVKLSRPGLQVRTRVGYFAVPYPPQPTPQELVSQLEDALANPVHYTGIHLQAVGDVATAAPGSRRKVVLRIDPRDLNFKPQPDGTRQCTLVTATAVFSKGRVPLLIREHAFTATISEKQAMSLSKDPVFVRFDLPPLDGVSSLRVAVRDESTGTMGTADVASSATLVH